jgi:hypothetical protein
LLDLLNLVTYFNLPCCFVLSEHSALELEFRNVLVTYQTTVIIFFHCWMLVPGHLTVPFRLGHIYELIRLVMLCFAD